MSQHSIVHAAFVIERDFKAPPAKLFAAFADSAQKSKWFVGPEGWEKSSHKLDFRPGGSESVRGGPPGGPVHTYNAFIWDIVENQRIVASYEMRTDATRISVSLATTEISANGAGSTLTLTEQGAFLDGHDHVGERERGTRELLNQLAAFLECKDTAP